MTKTYLVSEELLRQVLDTLDGTGRWATQQLRADSVAELRALLAKEPSEPIAYHFSKRSPFGMVVWDVGHAVHPDAIEYAPLYRKDA